MIVMMMINAIALAARSETLLSPYAAAVMATAALAVPSIAEGDGRGPDVNILAMKKSSIGGN